MGWDAFGLPAEQYAKKTGTPPRVTTEKNIATFRRQLKMLGFSYDWDRELATTDVAYFRWTQWIFLQLFDTWFDAGEQRGRPIGELPIPPEVTAAGPDAVRRYQDQHRLAYQSEAPVNWCPALGTVLANEEVDRRRERTGRPSRGAAAAAPMDAPDHGLCRPAGKGSGRGRLVRERQSAAAQLDRPQHRGRGRFLHWPRTRARAADRRAGSSKPGATSGPRKGFPAAPDDDVLRVYTTRPDTLFGATYMVVAPEHPLVAAADSARAGGGRARPIVNKRPARAIWTARNWPRKRPAFSPARSPSNPANQRPVPIWVADYVLASYGTGAIMAVPAHDTRDYEFARQFELAIVPVVDPGADAPEVKREEVLAGRAVFTRPGHGDPFEQLRRADDRRVQGQDRRRSERRAAWPAAR